MNDEKTSVHNFSQNFTKYLVFSHQLTKLLFSTKKKCVIFTMDKAMRENKNTSKPSPFSFAKE